MSQDHSPDPDRISTLPPPPDIPHSDTVHDELGTFSEVVRLLGEMKEAVHAESERERNAFYRWADERGRKDDANWEFMKRSLRRIDERLDEGDQRFQRIERWMVERDAQDRRVLDRISSLLLKPATPFPLARPLAGHVVVILEDSDELRSMMFRICTEAGADVYGARNPAEARDRIEHADCVTIDLLLGGEDGMVFARELRARRPECGALIVTGHITDQQIEDAAAFSLPVLEKPFTADQLVTAILAARAKTFAQAHP